MSDSTYKPKVYKKDGGDTLVLAYGATVTREDSALTGYNEPAADISGAIVSGKCTAVEEFAGGVHKTTLTLTLTGANDLDLADGAAHGTGIKIYDFPAGVIHVLGAVMDGVVTSTNAAGDGAGVPMSCGSVVGADDATLTSTEANIIPSTAVTAGASQNFHNYLVSPVNFVSPLDLYLNAAIADATSSGAVTIAVTGTLTIFWVNLGTY